LRTAGAFGIAATSSARTGPASPSLCGSCFAISASSAGIAARTSTAIVRTVLSGIASNVSPQLAAEISTAATSGSDASGG
jgi:hypothetical protein